MSRSFLTGLNLNKNELLNARIQNLQNAPSNPVAGQIYYDTDTNQITLWNGTAWVSLAAGGDVSGQITAAIDALTTTDIEEGTNLYFTDERAQDAIGNSVGTGLSYNDTTGAISVDTNTIASKTYVDGLVQGLNVKDSVLGATTPNDGSLPVSPSNLGSLSTIGGVSKVDGGRFLLKNQNTAAQNGIYVYTSANNTLTRAADQLTPEKGDYVLVTEGTYAATGWIATSDTTWTQFAAANEYTAGTNIAIAGNAISFSGILPIANGGTNANTAAGAKTELGFTTKYAENNTLLEPTSNVVTWTVTHNMNSRDVAIQVYENSGYAQVEVDVVRTNANTATLTWVATANVAADTYRAVVIG
jgi:hypothetical protein